MIKKSGLDDTTFVANNVKFDELYKFRVKNCNRTERTCSILLEEKRENIRLTNKL